MNLISRLVTLTCLFLFAVSCGYVGEKPLESKVIYETSELSGCDIDTDAFSAMMDRNIDEAISCLEQNFRDFQKGVQHDGSGAIDRSVISTFISRFMNEERDSILSSLDVLFKINMLILKDRPDFISADNIKNISKLLLITNHSAVKINRVIDDLDKMNGKYTLATLKAKRAEFQKSIENFSGYVSEIINSTMGANQSLDLEELIDDIADMINSGDKSSDFNVEDINDLLAFKKILVGGEKTIITSNEVIDLLNNLPTLAMIVFDAYYAKEAVFESEIGLFREYRRLISEFQTIFKYRDQAELLFKKDDFYEIAKFVADYDEEDNIDQIKANAFVDAFFTLKKHAVSEGDDEVRVSDVDRLAFYSKVALEGIASAGKLDDLIDEKTRSTRERRIEAQDILNDAQKEIADLFLNRSVGLPEFDLKDLISELAESLEKVDDFDIDYDLIKQAIPLKKLIMGGGRTDFNVAQLHTVIPKLKDLGLILFDALNYDKDNFSSEKNKYGFFIDLINSFKKMMFPFEDERNEVIYQLKELVVFADTATDNEYNIIDFEETIDVVLVKFLKGEQGHLSVADITTSLNYALEISESAYYNEAAYARNGHLLKSTGKIRKEQLLQLTPNFIKNEVPKITYKPLLYYQREFATLIEDTRFFKTDEGYQFFTHDIIRTAYGLNEASLYRFAAKKLLVGYCAGDNPDPEHCGVNAEELNRFLWDFKPLLEEFKLWSDNIESFANNCLYLTDLFQSVSDGDIKIGLKEGTEYLSLITSAVKIGDDILEGLLKRCKNQTVGTDEEREEDPTFLMACFRKNVLDVWMNEYGYKKYLKAFSNYLDEASTTEVKNLVVYLEQFVKDEPESPIMNKRWITLFAGAILNVEAMIIRFDHNRDNYLNPNEVDDAFLIYKGIIIELGELTGFKKRFAESSFKLMVKEMIFPEVADVLVYHYNPFASKRVSARRINIASILNYFATM